MHMTYACMHICVLMHVSNAMLCVFSPHLLLWSSQSLLSHTALGAPRLPWLVNLLRAWASWPNPGWDHLEAPLRGVSIHLKDVRVPEQQGPQAARGQVLCQDCVHPVGESMAPMLNLSLQNLQCLDASGLVVLISVPMEQTPMSGVLLGCHGWSPWQCLQVAASWRQLLGL